MRALASFLLASCISYSAVAQVAPPPEVIASTPQYDLAIRIAPDSYHIEVTGTLRLPPVPQSRDTIQFTLGVVMRDLKVEFLEPAESAGAIVPQSTTDGDDVHYVIRPRQPIAANRAVKLRFSYGGGEQTKLVFYIGPEGSFAGGPDTAWYPQFEAVHGRGRGRLTFSVPAGYTVLASGRSLSSTADEAKGDFVFEQEVPDQFSFAAARYTVLKRDGVVPMRAYLLRPHSDVAAYLDGSSRALAVLVREFGPYPYHDFAIAEVPTDKAGEAGFAGASMGGFMLADSADLDEPFNLAYYAHEIGHQWWGNLVTQTGATGKYMLNEAMAQFGSLRAVETLQGELAAEQYRRDGYPGYNSPQCGRGYLLFSASGLDHPLLDLPSSLASHELADSKGFLVLDLLSRTIGRENFRAALLNITRDHAFRNLTWEQFVDAIRGVSHAELGWFYSQWFTRSGAPDWQVTWTQQVRRLDGVVTQTEPYYRARLEVEAIGVNGERVSRNVDVGGAHTHFAWPVAFRVRSVVIDPHFYALHWLPGLQAAAAARGPSTHASYVREEGKLDDAETILRQALANVSQPDAYAARFLDEYEMARVMMKRKAWKDAQSHFDTALAAPTRDPDVVPWLFYRYAQVAQALHDDAKLRWAVDSAASADAALPAPSGAVDLARSLLPTATKAAPQ